MSPSEETRTCPYCFETIKSQAIRCKHCHASLDDSPVVQAKDQATIGGSHSLIFGGQGYRIEGGVHYTLSELDTLDEGTKQQLRQTYEDKVREFPELAQYHFALGLSYLDRKLYDLSTAALQRALGKTSHEANLLYYLALSNIAGRRPRTLRLSEIRKLESYLESAIKLAGEHAHFRVLLAIVKYDYYVGNGLRMPGSSFEELIKDALTGGIAGEEIKIMFSHLQLPSNEPFSILKEFFAHQKGDQHDSAP